MIVLSRICDDVGGLFWIDVFVLEVAGNNDLLAIQIIVSRVSCFSFRFVMDLLLVVADSSAVRA